MKHSQLFESNLNSEFIWFQRYITEHDLETQMEIEGDKIVFRVGEKLIEWNLVEARRIRAEVLKDAKQSYYYAKNIIKQRFELGELVISKDPICSYGYAKNVIKGRFELGEPVISKCAEYSFYYARYVIEGRWKIGEAAIATDTVYSQWYVKYQSAAWPATPACHI